MKDLIAKLKRNSEFYLNEYCALDEEHERRDRRRLGAREAKTISDLLRDAAAALEAAE